MQAGMPAEIQMHAGKLHTCVCARCRHARWIQHLPGNLRGLMQGSSRPEKCFAPCGRLSVNMFGHSMMDMLTSARHEDEGRERKQCLHIERKKVVTGHSRK